MTCDELAYLLPDLLDDSLPSNLLSEAQEALANCPDCQKELEAARQIRGLLAQLQAKNEQFKVSGDFEVRLFRRLRRERHSLALLDLTSKSFGLWLVELVNLLGHFLDSKSRSGASATTSPNSIAQ